VPDRAGDRDRFYDLMGELTRRCGGPRRLADCNRDSGWPSRGVYFFFEPGETRADARTPRVVRVGTHALRPSKTTLWGRLAQHQGQHGGALPGGGNHRGSIFRLHVGTALLATGDWEPAIRETWAINSSAPQSVRRAEYPLEHAVSTYIRSLPFVWLGVDDPPSPTSHRGVIEAGSVALLSNYARPALDPASEHWLGHHAHREAIRLSGLWNVNYVKDQHSPDFLDVLEHHILKSQDQS
jgi:hypothetical protein